MVLHSGAEVLHVALWLCGSFLFLVCFAYLVRAVESAVAPKPRPADVAQGRGGARAEGALRRRGAAAQA